MWYHRVWLQQILPGMYIIACLALSVHTLPNTLFMLCKFLLIPDPPACKNYNTEKRTLANSFVISLEQYKWIEDLKVQTVYYQVEKIQQT